MSPKTWKWTPVAIPITYLVAAHLAFTLRSPGFAAVAVAVLVIAALLACRGRFVWLLRVMVAVAGTALVAAIAFAGSPPVLLFVPPVAVPLGIAWLFGHTLTPGRTPLVARIARAVHWPDEPEPAVLAYARSVTWAWTLLLSTIAVVNLVLAANLVPGGVFDLAGIDPPLPVAPAAYTWICNIGTYVLIGGMLLAEYAVRLLRFPNYRFRNPVQFVQRVRARLPELMRSFRG
jgi:uncharacterized membrane protein